MYLESAFSEKDSYDRESVQSDSVRINKDNLDDSASLYEIEKILVKHT